VNQLAGQFPGAPPPPPAAPGFGAGVAQAIGGAGRPQAVNAAGRIDPANAPAPQALYAGQNMGGGSALQHSDPNQWLLPPDRVLSLLL
jgi:hypothetical protein